ncbi:TIGR03905 family TSCPD domain-containing protein [Maridesulfovibrio sp.]|uniref:TIGR03905 family TSCPD domain-containing protein n=1 Tax=Maridesulfovibrio sp. TaxID=2795000 RepID=UPI002A18A395|nr:TIGR03905 family TSCPD domain-containing protein [Maridesulfovibrio sp.]
MENITLEPTMMSSLGRTDLQNGTETFTPKGVCSKLIRFTVTDGKLSYVHFTGGCDGNLKGISALVTGMELEKIIETLSGITCGRKTTSCPDQLSRALREYMEK